MSLFCFLWTPLFYLFFRSLRPLSGGSEGVWALLLGSIVAILQFFMGALIEPGGFGLSRWLSACVDIVGLPALLPLAVYLLFRALRLFRGPEDFTGFALLWLIPGAAIRALSWSVLNDPLLLILTPLLWTAVGLGVPCFIGGLRSGRFPLICLSSLGTAALPLAASGVWWAFFSQKVVLGLFFSVITIILPLLLPRACLPWKAAVAAI